MGTEQDTSAGAAGTSTRVEGEPVTPATTETTFGEINEGSVTLPCGYVDGDGELHDIAHLRELTGEEEDILAAPKVAGSEKMTRILGNCLVKLGGIDNPGRKVARGLTIGDRTVLLLALRSVSLGSVYPFRVKCPSCGHGFHTGVSLDKLEITVMSDKKLRTHELTLPSGRRAVLKVMTGEDEADLEKKKGQFSKSDVLSLSIMARLKSLNGEEKISVSDVKSLTFRDRKAIRNWFQKVEGGVNTDIDVDCESCSFEFQTVLDIGQSDFFFPKELED